jgi:hypothetical protein
MLNATQHAAIRLLFRRGTSRREISRLTGHSRTTIRRVLCIKRQSQNAQAPSAKKARGKMIDAFEGFARKRLAEGRINSVQLL